MCFCCSLCCLSPWLAENAVNEFDENAWNDTFAVMTAERETSEDADAVSAREACDMVNQMLHGMQARYEEKLNQMTADCES